MQPKVAILTINYNSKTETLKLINSLKLLQGNFELFILENGSNKNRFEENDILKTNYKINYFKTNENLGFAGGNNLLIKKAKNFDYYWLLNNDCQITSANTLKTLIGTYSQNTKCGIVEPVVLDNNNKIWFAGGELELKKGKIKKLYYGKDLKELPKEIYQSEEINGAAMFIKKAVIEKIGFLDETFFHTGEDTDYSIRANKAGFELYINPQVNVVHAVSKSSGGAYSYKHMYYVERGRILLMKKYNAFSLQSVLYLLPFWTKRILAPTLKEFNLKASLYTKLGILDGFLKRTGKKF